MGLQSLWVWEIAFFSRPEVERWLSDMGGTVVTLATAGLREMTLQRLRGTVCHYRFNVLVTLRLLNRT